MTVAEAEKALKFSAVENVANFARLDVGREMRRGVPEIIFAEGKTDDELEQICRRMIEKNGRAIVTRLSRERNGTVVGRFGDCQIERFNHAGALVIRSKQSAPVRTGGRVGVLTAGTVDLGVAEECAMVAREMGCETIMEADVGVAGIHRLVEPLKKMIDYNVDCLVVVAGREGALPTVVAGLVDIPLIAVPASSGYGYGGGGEAALMAMLQACSLGLAVVNIDSGVAAGVVAAQIANRVAKERTKH